MRQIRLWATTLCALVFMAACTDSPTGPQPVEQQAVGTGPSLDNQTVQGCVIDGLCLLPPISGGGSTCDPYLQLDWSCDDGDGGGDCMTSQPGMDTDLLGLASCPDPRNPGGGGGYIPEPTPGDTCLTGDPALDSPAVKQGLQDIWNRSNPTAPQAQRLEQAAWIMQRLDGSYFTVPFSVTARGPCSINGNLNAPQGAVGFVHTHPFAKGEVQTICGAYKTPDPNAPGGYRDVMGPDGRPAYPVYENRPSIPDRELMSDLNATRAQLGQPLLAGVIIDANQTTVYTENAADGMTVLPRCGY